MKPCIYIRVSTEEQAREGLSLAEQERRCAAHATALGYDDVLVFSDPGVSDKSMDRPGIHELKKKDGLMKKSEFAYHREPVDKEIEKVQAKIESTRRRMQEELN